MFRERKIPYPSNDRPVPYLSGERPRAAYSKKKKLAQHDIRFAKSSYPATKSKTDLLERGTKTSYMREYAFYIVLTTIIFLFILWKFGFWL